MRVYLDSNATTQLDPAVLNVLEETLRDVFGNPSSIHKEGQTARRRIEEARESVAALIGATAREIVFTSGGTECNNAAIFGAARHHIVTTTIEHPSVLEPIEELARRGHEVTIVPPLRSGVVPAEAVIAALRPETRFVAMMLANNETGVVQPVADVARVCRERGIHLHCDAVQAAGKIDVDVSALGVDTLSLSAHKLHAPKGIGAMYVRGGLALERYLFGGAQERRRRAGTENVPLAVAFGVAAELARDAAPRARIAALRDRFEAAIAPLGVAINGAGAERLPNTSSVTFADADGEGIVIGLDLAGVAVSTGAACSSGRIEPSHVLTAMGLTSDEARATVRVSLSRFTTEEEIERAVAVLKEVVPRTRQPVPRPLSSVP
ncbi:MAG TPA: cysteine desulfurase family protein [Thermoanaerobaculia bacterium]|nr:cysteine desulfurase family protein [Thermoanaerobaculia bacterium]